ncbi:MAG: glycosyl hydrolase family 8 [Clostridium sp.]
MRKIYTIVFTIIMLLISIEIYSNYKDTKVSINFDEVRQESKEEKKLREFIFTKMIDSNGGVFTNYLDGENEGDITKGHFVLSESQGMLLQYYLKVDNEDLFERTVNYISENMMLDNGLISWRINKGLKEESSATIDELRIILALLKGADKYNIAEYKDLAINISECLYDNVIKDNYIVDFKDKYGCARVSTVCYQDIEALKRLTDIDSKWEPILKKSIEVVKGAFIDDNIPLYKREFCIENLSYDNEHIDMLLSTITIRNLAMSGEDVTKSIQWIKNRFQSDKVIYTSYNRETGQTECECESTSIYAIICDIANIVNDRELYNLSKKRMLMFQIVERNNELYGAFGDKEKRAVYSFDNLNALIAL